MSEFTQAPPPSGGIQWADIKGSLLVIEPLSLETGIQTTYGSTDAVRANVYVLTGPAESDDHPDTLVFPKVLAGQLKNQIGRKVVGRLGQGQAKASQSPPWVLEEASPDDLQKAQAWLDARKPGLTSAPPAQGQPAGAAAPF